MDWLYTDTDVSGIYSLPGLPADQAPRFAVNVDTHESDLTRIDPRQLPTEVSVSDGARPAAPAGGMNRQPSSLSASVLWIALGLLFFEPCLAWILSRRLI